MEYKELSKDLETLNSSLEEFKKEVKYNFDFKSVNFDSFSVEKLLKTIHNLCIVEQFKFCKNNIDIDNVYIRFCQIAQYHEQFEIAFKYVFFMFMRDIENIIKEITNIDTTVYISKNKFKIKVDTQCIQKILNLLAIE